MAWMVAGISAAGLVLGEINAQQQRADKKREMLANAEVMRNSPWTGMQTQVMGQSGQGSVAAGVQGAAQGAMLGSQFKKAFAEDAKSKPNTMSNNNTTMAGGFGDVGNPYAFDPDYMKA